MNASGACKFFESPSGCLRGDSCTYRHEKPHANGHANGHQSTPWGQHHHHQQQHHQQHQRHHVPPPSQSFSGMDGNGVDLAQGITSYSPGNPYASGVSPPCRFFLTEAGCRNGVSCPFAHVGAPPSYAPPPHPMHHMGYATLDASGYPMDMARMPPPPLPLQMLDTSGYPIDVTRSSPTSNSNASTPTANGSSSDTANGTPRRKLNIQANPSKKSNYEVISEIMPVLTRDIEGPFIAIDVECVATGPGVDDRDVARIAIVDESENVVYDRYVLPDKPILSYLTQLTGISESHLVGAPSLTEAMLELRELLPRDSVIVGQSIKKDLEWLGLEKEADYKQAFDVADLFRIPMQSKNGTIRYRFFSLRHVAKYLLGHDIQEADHDPVIDAKYAMKIFKQFRHLHESPARRGAVYQTLLQTPRTPSFAERYPVIDGVLMRVPRKPRENQNPNHQHHQYGQGPHQHEPSMPPPTYAPDPTLMT